MQIIYKKLQVNLFKLFVMSVLTFDKNHYTKSTDLR